MKEHKLLKIKISIEYEVVGDDIYLCHDMQRAGDDILRANWNDIMFEVKGNNGLKVKVTEIKKKEDLPEGYTMKTLPWLNVLYGNKSSETTIEEILKTTP
jgi:hypothetical protein